MYASNRFPEDIPIRNIKPRIVVNVFNKHVFKQIMQELGIRHHTSTAYHPESKGALERFHKILKSMIRTYCLSNEKEWDHGIPFLLFAVRDAKQESLGFSPFELVYGHTVRGPLKLLKEKNNWSTRVRQVF